MTRIDPRDLFLTRLPAPARRAFLQCTGLPLFRRSHWYLAGGAALALQVGHRQSRDLDFFTSRPGFAELELERSLLATRAWKTDLRGRGDVPANKRRGGRNGAAVGGPGLVPSDFPAVE